MTTENREGTPPLSLREQQKNLAGALIDADLPFMVAGNAIILQFEVDDSYMATLDRINAAKEGLYCARKMERGAINFTRGPMVDSKGAVHTDVEQITWFFGPDDEFEEFRHAQYPSPMFQPYRRRNDLSAS